MKSFFLVKISSKMASMRPVFFLVSLLFFMAYFSADAFVVLNTKGRINAWQKKENRNQNELETVVFSSRTPMRDDGEYIQPDNIFSQTSI